MNKTFKLVIACVFSLCLTQSYAQTFGVKAGLNLSEFRMKNGAYNLNEITKPNPGFHAGATAEFKTTEWLSIETGILLSLKGSKNKDDSYGFTFKSRVDLYYLEIPLSLKANYKIGGAELHSTFGPYFAEALYGRETHNLVTFASTIDDKEKESIRFGKSDEEMQRFDYGLNASTGIDFNSLFFRLSFDYGLANLTNLSAYNIHINNRTLSISIGYKFNS